MEEEGKREKQEEIVEEKGEIKRKMSGIRRRRMFNRIPPLEQSPLKCGP